MLPTKAERPQTRIYAKIYAQLAKSIPFSRSYESFFFGPKKATIKLMYYYVSLQLLNNAPKTQIKPNAQIES